MLVRVASGDGRNWAIFSQYNRWRYALGRTWGEPDGEQHRLLVIGLNPSIAGVDDDQTIRKDVGFAHRLGCTKLVKLNMFGLVSTDSDGLKNCSDPIGPENDEVMSQQILDRRSRTTILLAWGSHPMVTKERVEEVLGMLRPLAEPVMCLGKCLDGSPRHTSRLGYATPLEPWTPPW